MDPSSPSFIPLYSPAGLSVELVFLSHLMHLTYGHIDCVCYSQPQDKMVQKVQRLNEWTPLHRGLSQSADKKNPGTSGLATMDQPRQ